MLTCIEGCDTIEASINTSFNRVSKSQKCIRVSGARYSLFILIKNLQLKLLVFGLDLTFGVRFRVLVLSRACVRSTCQLTNAIKGGKNGAFSITQSEVESLVEILDFFVAVRVSSSALATALLKTAAAHDI